MDKVLEVPAVLWRAGGDRVNVIAPGTPGPDWRALGGEGLLALRDFLGQLNGGESASLSARQFVMRTEDLDAWDRLRRVSREEGYALGTLQSQDGKFARNVALKEVSASPGHPQAPLLDPVMVAQALASARITAAIERLSTQIEEAVAKVDWSNEFLAQWQAADVDSALGIVAEIHAILGRTGSVDETDWERVVGLEQKFRSQHQRLLAELREVGNALRFEDFQEAKAVPRRVPRERVQLLLQLEARVLRGLAYHAELMMVVKRQRGSLSLGSARGGTAVLQEGMEEARAVAAFIADADTYMNNRPLLQRLSIDGLVGGARRDTKVRRTAHNRRCTVQRMVRSWEQGALSQLHELPLAHAGNRPETPTLRLVPAA